jgi:regulator of extracellular matrix RemA (YlzA/DUF370 family)
MARISSCFNYFVISACLAAACLTVPVRASTTPDPTSQLAAIYAKTDAALDKKNADASTAFHSANFLVLDSNGVVQTADQQKARLIKMFASVTSLDITTRIIKCDYAEKTATVIISQHVRASVVDPDTSKAVWVSGDDQARELWTKGPTGWQIDVAQTLQPMHLTPEE